MRSATQQLAMWFGGLAGFAGVEHGYFEILQGDKQTEALGFSSMGPPCVPENVWHACEPAMSFIPNLLITGITSLVLGVVTLGWAVFGLQRRLGGAVLALLSVVLLLVGGGIVPPIIGFIGGVALVISKIRGAGNRRSVISIWRGLALLWPWSLIGFFAFLFGTVAIGSFSSDFVIQNGLIILVVFPVLLVFSVISARARDAL